MTTGQPRQPFLHQTGVLLQAPAQAWFAADGSMTTGIEGCYVSDARALSELTVTVAGSDLEHIASDARNTAGTGDSGVAAGEARLTAVLRGLDDDSPDPLVRLDRRRQIRADGMAESLVVTSALDQPIRLDLAIRAATDLADMWAARMGVRLPAVAPVLDQTAARWSDGTVSVELSAEGFALDSDGVAATLRWQVEVAPHGVATASWVLRASDSAAVVAAPRSRIPLRHPPTGRPQLDAWLVCALRDLEALQLALPDAPDQLFLAAGAPWYFTLFGRDSLWAARLILPVDHQVAAGTLGVLAGFQGRRHDPETAEHPGKILHELRRSGGSVGDASAAGEAMLPPLYYGTVDATALWVTLLHDAWRAGLPEPAVVGLLPTLRGALEWLKAATPADGFLAYLDESGHGLSNQGWKDSADGVRWRDGRLARGPVALCEVQGYAYEAAVDGAVLLERFGDPTAGAHWRDWAGGLKARFRAAYWIDDGAGGYPAIARDDDGAVDSLTSNIGHLLGTGLLDANDEARIADLLVDPRLASGYGVRTLADDSGGYWPLSYHCGSVWAHDTAIAIHGLLRSGFPAQASQLAECLVRAAAAFDFRMPELYSGDPASAGAPVPYPASCRPQAWSAAAAVVAAAALA